MATGEASSRAPEEKRDDHLLLYHYPYSFYGQKVLMALNEKKLQFSVQQVNIANGEQYQSWYLKLNPRGEVPVLKDGETIIVDSAKIINYLEDKYNDKVPQLLPSGEGQEIVDQHTHLNKIISGLPIYILTVGSFHHSEFTRSPKLPFILPVRWHMKAMSEKASGKLRLLAQKNGDIAGIMTNKAEQVDMQREKILNKEAFQEVLNNVDEVLTEIENQLAKNEGTEKWLVCDQFTVADIGLTILLERLNNLGLEERFWSNGKRPNVTKYFARVKQRESYKKTMPTFMFHLKTLIQGVTYSSG